MSLEALANTLPDHAKDLRLNLSSLLKDTTLTPQQQWGTLLCCAVASRQPRLLAAVAEEAEIHLSADAMKAARAAASIMAMNNVYYRFTHVVSDRTYAAMPARLRMQVIGKPGVAKEDFELWCLAASAIGGCSACMDSHEKTLREVGVSREAVQQSVRLAAVIHAIAVTLEAEVEPGAA